MKQYKNAIPLPRGRPTSSTKNQAELMFSQLLHYVAETNYRNLWKETYKKYYSMRFNRQYFLSLVFLPDVRCFFLIVLNLTNLIKYT